VSQSFDSFPEHCESERKGQLLTIVVSDGRTHHLDWLLDILLGQQGARSRLSAFLLVPRHLDSDVPPPPRILLSVEVVQASADPSLVQQLPPRSVGWIQLDEVERAGEEGSAPARARHHISQSISCRLLSPRSERCMREDEEWYSPRL
jgi:hypothetical protein